MGLDLYLQIDVDYFWGILVINPPKCSESIDQNNELVTLTSPFLDDDAKTKRHVFGSLFPGEWATRKADQAASTKHNTKGRRAYLVIGAIG